MTVRWVNPRAVQFAGQGLPGCTEVRLSVTAEEVCRECNDGQRYESYVEAWAVKHELEVDLEGVGESAGLSVGSRGALSVTVEKGDATGTGSVSASAAMLVGQRTRLRNQTQGVSTTTLRFVCVSTVPGSAPVHVNL